MQNSVNVNVLSMPTSLWDMLMVVIPIILSIWAIYISVRALQHQKKADELGVKPLISIFIVDEHDSFAVKMRNNGLGTAAITEAKFVYDNCMLVIKAENLIDILSDPRLITYQIADDLGFVNKIKTLDLSANEEISILTWEDWGQKLAYQEIEEIKRIMNDVTIELKYTDLYKHEYSLVKEFDL